MEGGWGSEISFNSIMISSIFVCSANAGADLVLGQGNQLWSDVLAPRCIESQIPMRSWSSRVWKGSWRRAVAFEKRLRSLFPRTAVFTSNSCSVNVYLRYCRHSSFALAHDRIAWSCRLTIWMKKTGFVGDKIFNN